MPDDRRLKCASLRQKYDALGGILSLELIRAELYDGIPDGVQILHVGLILKHGSNRVSCHLRGNERNDFKVYEILPLKHPLLQQPRIVAFH